MADDTIEHAASVGSERPVSSPRAHRANHWVLRTVASVAVLGGALASVSTRAIDPTPHQVVGSCAVAGPAATSFPALGRWTIVNQQTFDVASLPTGWDPFRGYLDGGPGQPHHSYREPSMLAFPGRWLEFENAIYSDGAGGSYHTVADAGVNEVYAETYDPSRGSDVEGYDVASHRWGFQWCTRFNGGAGFDTAFAFVPTNGSWPPEIDFLEHGPRYGNAVTLHIHWRSTRYNDGNYCDLNYPASNSQNCHANVPNVLVTVGRWHAYAVTWSTREIDVWVDGQRAAALTITPQRCTAHADGLHGYHDTGLERRCLPNGYVDNDPSLGLEPFVWDMQVNSYDGTTTYTGDQTDLAWFRALRPTVAR
jgi:hypothetical protein